MRDLRKIITNELKKGCEETVNSQVGPLRITEDRRRRVRESCERSKKQEEL